MQDLFGENMINNPFPLVLFIFSSFLCIEIADTFEICVYMRLNFGLSYENGISYCL